ncbi:hypothetical protein ZOSMA_62G00450 [Zostera marina]|uniref:Uncharacterized protein n=1 Tax=Zostera marina TaxID=29655 RepID=A0A0K9NVI0_ZOSMR|nr:hypothetical protein ZOSMA_62G00450 [Zostera marina]
MTFRNSRDDSTFYLLKVKERYKDNVETFEKFLHLLVNFREGRICFSEVVKLVKELFKEFPELILGFMDFISNSDN